jgi:4-diphosphocytidyl-2C-methyl-D-erythritol kinase
MKKLNDGCAVMSGSGSSVIAICGSEEEAQKIYEKVPDSYYKVITKTCKTGIQVIEE